MIQFPPQTSDTLRVTWNAVNNALYYQVTLKDGVSNPSKATAARKSILLWGIWPQDNIM